MKNLREQVGSFKVVRKESELQVDSWAWVNTHANVWQKVLNKVWTLCGLIRDNTKEN